MARLTSNICVVCTFDSDAIVEVAIEVVVKAVCDSPYMQVDSIRIGSQ